MRRPAWSLRLRVAVAFLLTTALAMVVLGWFVQWRVAQTLDEGLHDQLESELDRLVAVPPPERAAAVAQLSGELHAQLLAPDGEVVASSAAVPGRLVGSAVDDGYTDLRIRVLDDVDADEDPDDDETETESEPATVLVRSDRDGVLVLAVSREDADEAVGTVRTQLLVSGPVALAVAGVLGYVVAGLGLRPIERMRARADTISSRSAGERLPVPAAAELGRLAVTLNAMLARLDDGLERERRFVADASHELRTPLALLLTEVELALSGPRTTEELREALRSAEHEVRRLIALGEDLLALASADAGGLQLRAESVDLGELAAEVAARFRPSAEAAGRSITVTGDPEVRAVGDPDRLGRVVANLVDNALRHGAGAVGIAVAGGARPTLEVTDEGPGFAEDRPFDRFAGSHGSAGLGLAIVDEVVRAHGGRVTIHREHDRTVVRVALPA